MGQYTISLDRNFEEIIEKHCPNEKRQTVMREAMRFWFLHYWNDSDLENALASRYAFQFVRENS